ncbi:TonB-dependent receptor [Lachnospiraceae bacterium ASD5720]|uniref:TonB-dependent receptor n=2 Tax=Diplocloster agilis TaxID=2850323 RepID=A0A949K540_9FIRM|nr:TonB-dependent receptor [Diplocloster agilis]
MSLPLSAFAFTAEEGKTVNAYYGDKYVSADGEMYYSPSTYQYIAYDSNGNESLHTQSAGNSRTKLMIKDSSGSRQIMCIESGIDYNAGGTYNSVNGKNSSYFQNLPTTAQYGIMLTSVYGWRPGKTAPISGTNEDDFSYATQTILWEYQQQLRTSPTTLKANSYGIPADTYYQCLKGRPAEKCYNWLLTQMQSHATIPSFASNKSSSATTYTLKYNQAADNYSLTLTDTNNTLSDIKFSASGITVSRSGNKYTFTSNKMIETAVSVTAQKNVPGIDGNFLVWGYPGKQTMMSGAEDPVVFYLKIKTETTGVGHIVKHSEDGKVANIKFNIAGNGMNQTVTTKTDGTVDIELMPGVYTVTELTEDKYEPQNVQRVTIVSGNTSTVTFSNTLKRGDLQVIKSSEDNLVEGVTFHLYGTSLSGIAVDEYAVTDKNGVATFKDVLISGTTPYTIEEVDAAIRYVVPANQTAPIKWKEITTRNFTNILKKFAVTVTKSDREEGTAQGNASLAGAVYGIYKGETLVDKYVTDQNGQFTTKEYVCDNDWTVREITPSEGYLLDTTIHKVGAEPQLYTVEHNQTANDVNEQVIKGNIAIIKHTDDGETKIETPESGATFEIYLKSAGSYTASEEDERDIIVCDENGFGQTKDMPYGVYTVHQTVGLEGRELMKDFDVFIAQNGQTYRYLINNANFESYIKVVKVDAESGKTIPYAGAGFQIYDPTGNLVTMSFTYPTPTTIDTFYTDANGCLVTPEKLEYGKGYSLVEVQAPYGYVLDSTPVYFDVTQDNATEESGVTVIKVDKPNMAQKGTITVEKTGEVFYGVSVSGSEDAEVIYQPIYEIAGLSDAVYEIRAAEDIITPDGTVRFTKGEVVDTVTTGEDGFAKSRELYLGKYEVQEIKAPYGMVLNDEIHTAELVYAGQNVSVTETATSFVNERQKAEISLKKTLETSDLFGIGQNGELKNISFGLFAAEELVSASGTSIPADGLIEIVTLDESGNGTVKTDLPMGSYYVKELATDEHYILPDTKYPVTFEYAGQETAKVQLAVNDGEAIENDLIYGSVSGKKVDENGEPLGGALIGLFKSNDTEFTKENALITVTSREDGSFSFEQIPFGIWYVREIEQPTGFVLNETVYEVNIAENEQVVEIEIVNEFVRGNITLTKVDADFPDNKLTGATFEVYQDNNADGKPDDGDTLIGTLTESEAGIYEMKDLLYGHYLVKESKAPDGFLLDTGVYSVFIETDGMTYSVENKAGVGFINEAMKGNLKIVKTSSDGKVEGFSFRITGANGYDVTLKTDENGEIFIEGLRIGEYTVSEVADEVSAPYSRPADKKANVMVGSTTIVEMHNVVIDTPKTGDNSKLGLWLALLGVSAAGIGVTVYAGVRKKKKEDAE